MVFSDEVIKKAWERAGGRCECTRTTHGHVGRHNKVLELENQGREGYGAWEAHHISSIGGNGFPNCEILCWDCHKKTRSYGG